MGTEHGFSLLELLITLAIIGILASIVYPIYTHVIIKTHRIEAKLALMSLAQHMETYAIKNNHSYAYASLVKLAVPERTDNNYYRLSLESTANTYQLTATASFSDPECYRFILNELSEKKSMGNLDNCW